MESSQIVLQVNSTKHPILYKIFPRKDSKGTLPRSFYLANIISIPKLYQSSKQWRKQNYTPASLMNTDAK